MKNMKIDKENEVVGYNDNAHSYWIKQSGMKCISVTTLIHKFVNFDEEFWSKYKAVQNIIGKDEFDGPVIKKATAKVKEKRAPASELKTKLLDTKMFKFEYLKDYPITEEEVLKEQEKILATWAEKREKSCERGTKIHKDYELSTLAKDYSWTGEYNIEKFDNYDVKTDNIIQEGQYVLPELLISRISDDQKLRVAGQADLVIVDGNEFTILDFKTNEEIKKNSFYNTKTRKKSMMKYPLNNIEDENYWHYTLQLSLYAWMIMKNNPNLKLKGLFLLHHDHSDNKTVYELEYKPKDIERMLIFYRKQTEYEEYLKNNEPCK